MDDTCTVKYKRHSLEEGNDFNGIAITKAVYICVTDRYHQEVGCLEFHGSSAKTFENSLKTEVNFDLEKLFL